MHYELTFIYCRSYSATMDSARIVLLQNAITRLQYLFLWCKLMVIIKITLIFIEYVDLTVVHYAFNKLTGNCEWSSGNYPSNLMIFRNYDGKGFIQHSLSNLEF